MTTLFALSLPEIGMLPPIDRYPMGNWLSCQSMKLRYICPYSRRPLVLTGISPRMAGCSRPMRSLSKPFLRQKRRPTSVRQEPIHQPRRSKRGIRPFSAAYISRFKDSKSSTKLLLLLQSLSCTSTDIDIKPGTGEARMRRREYLVLSSNQGAFHPNVTPAYRT